MKIKIIAGTYGFRPDSGSRVVAVNMGETCDVAPEEAKRLVALGVAQYFTAEAVVTDDAAEDDGGAGANLSGAENANTGGTDAHLDPDQLQEMTNADLRKLAEDMGIDTAKLKTKAQLIAAIADVPLENAIAEDDDAAEDDGSTPPDLGDDGIVV